MNPGFTNEESSDQSKRLQLACEGNLNPENAQENPNPESALEKHGFSEIVTQAWRMVMIGKC